MKRLIPLFLALLICLPAHAFNGPSSFGDGFIKPPSAIISPDTIQPAHMISWFRADSGVTEGTGGVSDWADKRGGNLPLAQSNSAKRPALNATSAAFNNQPTIQFTQGNSDYLINTDFPDFPDEATIVVVGSATGSDEQVLAAISQFSDFNSGLTLFYEASAVKFTVQDGSSTTASYADTLPVSPGIHVARYKGSETRSDLFLNSTTSQGNASPGNLATTQNRLTLGCLAAQNGWFMSGEIAEVMIWDKKLTDAELLSVIDYAKARYGF